MINAFHVGKPQYFFGLGVKKRKIEVAQLLGGGGQDRGLQNTNRIQTLAVFDC